MTITLAPPTWEDGELLSAAKLNQLTDTVNAIKGASRGPTGIFVKHGEDKTWYCRRKYRYLHVTYTSSGDSCEVDIDINGTVEHTATTLRPSGYTVSFDLDAITSPPAMGDFYGITVTRDGDNFSFLTEEIRESSASSPTGTGSYTSPPTWGATDVVESADLNTLADTVLDFSETINGPSATFFRPTDSQHYKLRRRNQYLYVNYTATNSPQIRILVNGTTTSNDSNEYPSGTTKTIDLSTVSGGPSVGDFYSLEVRRTSGSMIVNYITEGQVTDATYAPTWSEGDTLPDDTNIDTYATVLDAAYDIIGVVGWQFAAINGQTGNHPRWGFYKSKRYLHYLRNGSTAALLIDPAGIEDDVSLSGTGADFATYDLDSIGWLVPGGLLYGVEFDVIWLDDEA